MNLNKISASTLSLLNLQDDADEAMFEKAVADLAAKAQKSAQLEKELSDLKTAQISEKIDMLISKGIAEGKITKQLGENLKADYKDNPEGLKSLIDTLPAQVKVIDKLEGGKVPEKYRGKTLNELYLSGELEAVKRDYPQYYDELKNQNKK